MSKRNAPSSHTISGVFVFLLLGIFAVFSTVMVLLGVRAYKGTAERAVAHNDNRIASAYMRSMVRSNDGETKLRLEDIGGIRSVTLLHEYDDEAYVTRMYVYDGMLRELFTSADSEFEPDFGEPVCAAQEMVAELNGRLMTVKILNEDEWTTVDIALRCEVIE